MNSVISIPLVRNTRDITIRLQRNKNILVCAKDVLTCILNCVLLLRNVNCKIPQGKQMHIIPIYCYQAFRTLRAHLLFQLLILSLFVSIFPLYRKKNKNLGLIGSAVLTFIGYKQTDKHQNKQTDKPNLYIDVKKISNNMYHNWNRLMLNMRKISSDFYTKTFSHFFS